MTLLTLGMAAQAQLQPAWSPKAFPIGFWCGPPEAYTTKEQYRRIAEAGFTVVLPPCEGKVTPALNRRILDLARAAGLKAIVSDSRMPLAMTGKPGAENALKAVVNDYRRYPALLGYFLTDEPGADQFAGLAEVVAALRNLDPDHPAYINLFPNYASTDLNTTPSQLNVATYDEYLARYLRAVRPDLLSWDHYHFLKDGDRPGFFGNLASGQRAALAWQVPFWQIVLSVQHGPYRALGENELRFEAMQSLAYGAQGLLYFTYWLPPDDATFQWSHGIMNRDGTPGPLYAPVRKVNREVRALAKWLYGAIVADTFQTGDIPPDGRAQPNDLPVKVTGPGNLTVGFLRGDKGYVYVLVTNRDYRSPIATKVALSVGAHVVEILSLSTNRWSAVPPPSNSDDPTTLDITLGPAGAALVRWK
jgi:hypothetical protein